MKRLRALSLSLQLPAHSEHFRSGADVQLRLPRQKPTLAALDIQDHEHQVSPFPQLITKEQAVCRGGVARVARFFLVQHTKMGRNMPKRGKLYHWP
jgi:hypothetical protein